MLFVIWKPNQIHVYLVSMQQILSFCDVGFANTVMWKGGRYTSLWNWRSYVGNR